MERKYFAFFESYFEAIEVLPKKYQRDIYHAICKYCLKGEVDEALSGVSKGIFLSLKPALDKNRKKSDNAANKWKKTSEMEANSMRTSSGHKPNVLQNNSELQANNEQTNAKGDYNKEEINNSNSNPSLKTSKKNIKGKEPPGILRDDSPEKYKNDKSW